MGRLDPNKKPLTMKDFVDAGLTKPNGMGHGVKILAGGKERLRTPLSLEVFRVSQAAIEAIEAVGGEVTTYHFTKLSIRALLKPEKFDILPKRSGPPPKYLNYYRSYKNRGYLSPQVQMKKLLVNRPDLVQTNEEKETLQPE
jgi:large subunit ribosomal protein L15